MATTKIPTDVQITGALAVSGLITGQTRAGLAQEDLKTWPLHPQDWRVWDAFQTLLTTAAADDLGITQGAFATGLPYITTGDVKAAGTVTRYARTLFTLPPEYVAGETILIRVAAGMLTTVAATSAVIDFEVYLSARTTLKTGSELVAVAAQSINSLTFAELTFAVNPIGLDPGDILDIRMTITTVDAATGTAVIGAVAHAEVLLDIKG